MTEQSGDVEALWAVIKDEGGRWKEEEWGRGTVEE
jgi:hypothetical protein